MHKRTFVVTGGNSGIGKATAVALAKQGEHVVIVSRNVCKGEAALAEIRTMSGNPATELVVGDLGSVESAKQLAAKLLAAYPNIAVLVNNAGVWPLALQLNVDGLENAFMVNHLAPYILSNMLLDRLRRNRPSRIVNVNAGLYIKGKIDLATTPYGKDFGRFSTYMNTKLCNIYFTQKLSRLLDGSGVTVNAVHPGVIRTNLAETGGLFGWLLRQAKKFWAAPEEGARPVVWLATAPKLEQTNGRYFDLTVEKPYAEKAQNDDLRDTLWDLSGKLASC
jgi:NAD(P)-dependent dehydrogenase (short-subunit alcohol dehydrogenase family)